MVYFNNKKRLLTGVAISSLLVLTGSIAHAQVESNDDIVDEVVATGIRLANKKAIDAKRNSVTLSDGLASDDIGRVPDFNVSDALKRIAGVSTVPEEDEGQFVSIRGINPDLTWVTLDGAAVATSNGGENRRVSLEFFPASIVSGLEVTKSRTPDVDGNTIGGQVDIKTRSAFDADGLYAVATALVGVNDGDGAPFGIDDRSGSNRPSWRVNGTVSNTFGKNDDFGVVLAGSFVFRDRDEERILPLRFQTDGAFSDPSTSYAPGLTIWSTYNNPITRFGGFGKLEYQPSDRLNVSLQGQYFYQRDFARRESELFNGGTANFDTRFSGTITGASFFLGHDQFEAENLYAGTQFLTEYESESGWDFELSASHSYGEFFQDSPDIDFRGPSVDVSYEYRGGSPFITFDDPAFALDPSNHPLRRVRPFRNDFDNNITEIESSVGKGYLDTGIGFEVGVKYRMTDQDNLFSRDVFNYTGGTATLADFQQPTDYSVVNRPGVSSLFVDQAAVFDFIDANPNDFDFTAGTPTLNYRVDEDVLAAYGALSFVQPNYQVIMGARYEDTKVTSRTGDEVQEGSYGNLLPSVLVNYDLSEDLKLRLSYAMALGRANTGDLRIANVVDPSAATLTVNGGNPDLKPRVSNNFDASLEYYFDGGSSILSFAAFHKDIDDEVFTLSTEGTFDGRPAILNIPQNAEGSTLTGFEVGLVKDSFDFLPEALSGLGLSANYTYIDASTRLLAADGSGTDVDFVFEQPNNIFNAALFYATGPFEAQLTYNYTSDYHAGFSGDIDFTDTFDDFDQFDFQMRYDINDHFQIQGEVRNINDEPLERRTGPNQILQNDISDFGRSYFVGFSYKY